ncbi:hypothetical protein MYIN104542_24860 [Mycobacterium intermedium]
MAAPQGAVVAPGEAVETAVSVEMESPWAVTAREVMAETPG